MFNTQFAEIVEKIMAERKMTITSIAFLAGVGRSRLSTLVNNPDHMVMEEGPTSVLTKIRKAFPAYFPKQDIRDTRKGDQNEVQEFLVREEVSNYIETPPPIDRTEELISTLKEHNKILKEVIEKNLDSLQTNLRTSQLLLRSLQTSQSAQHDVMMGSLERLEKRKKGSLAADADRLELELNLQLQRTGSNADGGK